MLVPGKAPPTGVAPIAGIARVLLRALAVAAALALVSACDTGRTGRAGERGAAPAETLVERTARANVTRLWFPRGDGVRARATLRVPRGARNRSLACVVIAGGHEHGWMTAEYLDAGPGVA